MSVASLSSTDRLAKATANELPAATGTNNRMIKPYEWKPQLLGGRCAERFGGRCGARVRGHDTIAMRPVGHSMRGTPSCRSVRRLRATDRMRGFGGRH